MLARAKYHSFHAGNIVSDPPTLQRVMEAEVLKAFTSDVFSFERGQGVCER